MSRTPSSTHKEDNRTSSAELYAQIVPQYLANDQATKENIFSALDTMQRKMATNPSGQDMAVVMFSGHGAMIDGRLFVPMASIREPPPHQRHRDPGGRFSAGNQETRETWPCAGLLDACHSGAVAADWTGFAPNADLLRAAMAGGNISVLTSSSAAEVPEKTKWKNGAFTKVLIEALGKAADENHDGMISMSELTAYISKHLPGLTGDLQHPGIEQRFQSKLFAARL